MAGEPKTVAETLTEEIDGLRQTFVRVTVVAIALLYFALAGLTSAMARVDGDEVARELDPVRDLNRDRLVASYVFSRRLANLPVNPKPVDEPAVVDRVSARLETLATEWFSVKFELLGTTVGADLRIVAPLLPFLVALLIAYLWVTHRQVGALEDAFAAALAESSGSPVPVWQTAAYRRHPHVLVSFTVVIGAGVLLWWLVGLFSSMQELVAADVLIDYVNTVAWAALCLMWYVSDVTGALRQGADADRAWSRRLRHFVSRVRTRVLTSEATVFPRGQILAGSTLVLLTLVVPTTQSCDDAPRTGYQYLDDREDAMWFNGFISSFTDFPMRPLYAASVVASAGAVLVAFLPLRINGRRRQAWARRSVVVARVVSSATTFLAVCSICTFGVSDVARTIGNVATVALWIGLSIWLWRTRARPEDRVRRSDSIAVALFPLALTFGIQAGRHVYELGLYGVLTLVVGGLLQLRTYRSLKITTMP